MATVTELHLSLRSFDSLSFKDTNRTEQNRIFRRFAHPKSSSFDVISVLRQPNGRRMRPCRFRSEDRGELEEKEKKDGGISLKSKKSKGALYSLKSFLLKVSGAPSRTDEYRNAVAKTEEIFFSCATQVGRYLMTMMSTGVIVATGFQLSGGDSQLNTLIWYSWLGGIIIGTMIGSNMVLEEHYRAGPRNIVITGSTRGLGKALAREFLLSGDRVVVASRSPESVQSTVGELEENLKEGIRTASPTSGANMTRAKVVGVACDVCKPEDVEKLANFAVSELGSIDIWINNAGTNKGFRPLLEFADEDIEQIVSTNLIGSLLCTREAMRVMKSQEKGGHIFNMDGAGSGGSSTPLTAVYGSTKCGLRQLQSSLLKESKRLKVGVHTASPGMVLTDLLLREKHYMQQRQTEFETGLKAAHVFPSQMPWRCTQKTHGSLFFHSQLFAHS